VTKRSWQELDDEALEKLLVERWLLRGCLLALMFAAAVGTTYIGLRGPATFVDQLTLGAFLGMAIVAGAIAFVMRLTDIRIHRELWRRRSSRGR